MPRARKCECGSCKTCKAREASAAWRAKNPERHKELAAESYRRHAAKRRAKQYAWKEENHDRVLANDREYTRNRRPKRKRDPLKQKARMAAYYAVQRGELIPQPCEACGDSPVAHDGRRAVHAHHDDYSKPLEVRWLCYPCHGKEHRRYTEAPT